MVYVRTKKVKGENYLYLVKSVWDKKKSTSRQEIIKYLGNATEVSTDDIPVDYRNDPKITAFLSSNAAKGIKQREELISKVQKDIFKFTTQGNLDATLDLFETYTRTTGMEDFYEKILTPVMHNIGDLWKKGKLSVATEHVASNIVHDLVKIIAQRQSKKNHKGKVLLCTPSGEEHNLSCNILESFLLSKGFRTMNLSPSAPTESILEYISNEKPDIALVSITLEDNIKTGQRLVKKIKEKFNLPILVGGQAIENNKVKFDAKIIQNESINSLPKILKVEIS